MGRRAVAVQAGNDLVRRVVLARLSGGRSQLITLEPPSPEYRIGDVVATLP